MSVRNIEDLHLEEITEEYLTEECEEMGRKLNVDTRQGSLYRDAAAGHIIRIANYFDNLRSVNEIISLDSCTGEILDEYMRMRGLYRNPAEATPAKYHVNFTGNYPDIGSTMSCAGHLFVLVYEDGEYLLISEEVGSEMNDLTEGELVIPDIDVDGLISATLGSIAVPALDIESDKSARQRLLNRISGPDENGNKSQFKTWCESVEGVGRARIIPLWDGPYTVMGVIVDRYGKTPTEKIVSDVQDYVDPGCTGMGEGVASIGQFFTAVAAETVFIDVKVSVLKKTDATYSGIEEDFKELLDDYFTRLSLEDYSDKMSVRIAHIGALLDGMESVIDYDGLTLNGGASNVPFNIYQIPVVREVVVDGNIQ